MNFFRKSAQIIQRTFLSKNKPITLEQLILSRKCLGIQIEPAQLLKIVQTVKPPSNFLIFGLGKDSGLWLKINPGGKTFFIEDDKKWFEDIKKMYPKVKVCLVDYNTRLKDWQTLLNEPRKLWLELPADISETSWDVILIDGPAGFADDKPGRMKSIYMASRLIKHGGDVFLHDCDRQVEQIYSDKFLGNENLVSETGEHILRHYQMLNPRAAN